MAELKCVVENCTYNNDKCCCKGDIMVGGKEAQKENDTCCESFKDRTGESASNAMNPCRTISIDCEAVKCVYNEGRHCSADHIGIAGDGASEASHTECASFRER